jgi:hypothetical protein
VPVSAVCLVRKDASAQVRASADATGKHAIALLADIGKQAEALGYRMTVKLRETAAPVAKAATISSAVKAAPEPEWPSDLASPRWRP